MCFSAPVQPLYGKSGNDLHAYLPHPIKNDKGKTTGYSAKEYDVHVRTDDSTQWNLAKMENFAKQILLEFKGPAFTYISYNQRIKGGRGEIDRTEISNPYLLIKDENGNISKPKEMTEGEVDKQHEEDNLRQYAKIYWNGHFGSKNKRLYDFEKIKTKFLQLERINDGSGEYRVVGF